MMLVKGRFVGDSFDTLTEVSDIECRDGLFIMHPLNSLMKSFEVIGFSYSVTGSFVVNTLFELGKIDLSKLGLVLQVFDND